MEMAFVNKCNGFDEVYRDMCVQFPPEEMKPIDVFEKLLTNPDYKVLQFYDEGVPVGYMLCLIKDFIWVDYFAVYSQYHSQGYGSRILEFLFEKYSYLNGVYFEVEREDVQNPCTSRRLKFYARLGCINTGFNYYFPNSVKLLKMELLYKPLKAQKPANSVISADIRKVFDVLHFDVPCREEIYKRIVAEN